MRINENTLRRLIRQIIREQSEELGSSNVTDELISLFEKLDDRGVQMAIRAKPEDSHYGFKGLAVCCLNIFVKARKNDERSQNFIFEILRSNMTQRDFEVFLDFLETYVSEDYPNYTATKEEILGLQKSWTANVNQLINSGKISLDVPEGHFDFTVNDVDKFLKLMDELTDRSIQFIIKYMSKEDINRVLVYLQLTEGNMFGFESLFRNISERMKSILIEDVEHIVSKIKDPSGRRYLQNTYSKELLEKSVSNLLQTLEEEMSSGNLETKADKKSKKNYDF